MDPSVQPPAKSAEQAASATAGSIANPNLQLPAVLVAGFALGTAGDALLQGSDGPGLNFLLLAASLGVAVWVLLRFVDRRLSREALVTLATGIALSGTMAIRDAAALRLLTFLAALVAFALPAALAGAAWLRRSGISDYVEAVAWAGVNALLGAFRLVKLAFPGTPVQDVVPTGSELARPRRPARAMLRGLFLAIPFLLAFGGLFMSADRMFADLVKGLVDLDYDQVASHVFLTLVLSWLACGYLCRFLNGTRLTRLGDALGRRPAVGIVEIGTALVLVDVLFLLFVGVQFRYLFGGSALVEVTPGLTYAEYVREGFEHLALACALVLPSLLAADWLLDARQRRDLLVFRGLGALLLLLLLVIIASALERVRAYQAAYGLTESRFYGAAFVGWLTLLTAWFAGTVLRGRRDRFALPALVSAFGFVAVLVAVNPDAWIARTNLARGATVPAVLDRPGEDVDARYLASLSADAVPVVMNAVEGLAPEPRCVLARGLLERWGPAETKAPDWRSWNWSVARARQLVSDRADALRAMVASVGVEVCPPTGVD